jgi:hypothetical protein
MLVLLWEHQISRLSKKRNKSPSRTYENPFNFYKREALVIFFEKREIWVPKKTSPISTMAVARFVQFLHGTHLKIHLIGRTPKTKKSSKNDKFLINI